MSDDEDWQHPGWSEDVEVEEDPGLQFADFDTIKHWTVKLQFIKDNQPRAGSGLFLNLPDIDDKLTILTAAHNLSSLDGTPITNLVVIYNDPDLKTISVPDNDIYVSPTYKDNGAAETDYGVIRIDNPSKVRRGFGFSVKLAYAEDFKGNVYVSGFQDKTPAGHPVTSTGSCIACYAKKIEYDVKTQPGISGSAVWIEYKGCQTVVAVQYAP